MFTETALAEAGLCFGHGYADAHDEAVALVLAAAELDPFTGAEILDRPVTAAICDQVEEFLQRRIGERVPTAYILGYAALGNLFFRCDSRALVPRSPLHAIIEQGYQPWYSLGTPGRIVDVCCGGGSLGLLAAAACPASEVLLLDMDSAALSLAEENRVDLNIANAMCLQTDLLDAVDSASVDVLLANPPYVDQADMEDLPPEYLHEPRVALEAGPDGLDLVHRLLREAARVLSPGGVLFLEVGNSAPALEESYPNLPITWLDLPLGGHGVGVLSRNELAEQALRRR